MITFCGENDVLEKFSESQLLEAFKLSYMQNKDMIMRHFREGGYNGARSNSNPKRKKGQSITDYYQKFHYSQLMNKFKEMIDERMFFDAPPWWCYLIDEDDTGIRLCLAHMDYPVVEENPDGTPSVCAADEDEVFPLVELKYRMVTVEEFAEIYNSTPVTVRQWIRRGKVTSAFKDGNIWRIPELATVYGRGYPYRVYYYRSGYTADEVPAKFGFMMNKDAISIEKIDDSSRNYIIKTYVEYHYDKRQGYDKNSDNIIHIEEYGSTPYQLADTVTMNYKDKESFELSLLENPMIYADQRSIIRGGVDYL